MLLGLLCSRPRHSLALFCALSAPAGCALPFHRLLRTTSISQYRPFCLSNTRCSFPLPRPPASIWHTLLPSFRRTCRTSVFSRHAANRGEGSWNVAWDARPARWLHHLDSAWLLFGVSAQVIEPAPPPNLEPELVTSEAAPCSYRVTGVVADGRCLFRAIAHMACLRKGGKAPDEDWERELADELRAQVAEELLKRRKEVEVFIDGDFDEYVERIGHPYVWGGEPELLMASHVLKTPISVYSKVQSSGNLVKIAIYGAEYRKAEENPINVLFHGYGHYDILETIPESK